jgi:hypothetical protein
MLAALLATRSNPIPPPPPTAVFYHNQVVAATTTFSCIFLAKKAAFLTTSPTSRYRLLFSSSGQEAIVNNLDRLYYKLVGPKASDNPDLFPKPKIILNLFLSNTIAQVIAVVVELNSIIQALPVANENLVKLMDIQTRVQIALGVLRSLAVPPDALSFAP